MKKIVVIIMCLAAVQCADAKMMTLQEAKEKARAQMNSVQEYMRNKMDGMQIASQAAYESIVADAAAAKQSTVEFIKAHKNELMAAGLLVSAAGAVAIRHFNLKNKNTPTFEVYLKRAQSQYSDSSDDE